MFLLTYTEDDNHDISIGLKNSLENDIFEDNKFNFRFVNGSEGFNDKVGISTRNQAYSDFTNFNDDNSDEYEFYKVLKDEPLVNLKYQTTKIEQPKLLMKIKYITVNVGLGGVGSTHINHDYTNQEAPWVYKEEISPQNPIIDELPPKDDAIHIRYLLQNYRKLNLDNELYIKKIYPYLNKISVIQLL